MAERAAGEKLHFGFLRIVSLEAGFVGGLLVTNRLGRPLEFQCTAPVKPNRTQELLYGATLQPFLYSEVLGKTLCQRISVSLDVLIIDQYELLDLRLHVETPLILLPAQIPSGGSALDAAQCHAEFGQDRAWIERLRGVVPATADVREPLERVRDALAETLRTAA